MKEIWRGAKGYEDRYLISNLGNVKTKDGNFKKPTTNNGYMQITFYGGEKGKVFGIHRLVAIAFLENPENKPQVNHIDGDKTNNAVNNLEWVTAYENKMHAIKNNLAPIGVRHYKSVLSELDVKGIRDLYKHRIYSQKELREIYGTTSQNIHNIINYKTWKYI